MCLTPHNRCKDRVQKSNTKRDLSYAEMQPTLHIQRKDTKKPMNMQVYHPQSLTIKRNRKKERILGLSYGFLGNNL